MRKVKEKINNSNYLKITNSPLKAEIYESFIYLYFNANKLGYCYREIDGYYVFVPEEGGTWDRYSLSLILDKLRELNEPFNREVEKYFNEYKNELSNYTE